MLKAKASLICWSWIISCILHQVTAVPQCSAKNATGCVGTGALPGSVLIYGGAGIFGSFLVKYFRGRHFTVTSVDNEKNDEANLNIILRSNLTLDQQAYIVTNAIPKDLKFNAIICTKTGWVDSGGSLTAPAFLKDAENILNENLWSSLVASSLAPSHLHDSGVLVLIGGHLALKPMPRMIAYSVAKAAVHQLVRSMGAEGSGLPVGAKALAILPAPMGTHRSKRRKSEVWNQLKNLASIIFSWIQNPTDAPASGSLIQFITSEEKTQIVISNPIAWFYTWAGFFAIGFVAFWIIIGRIVRDIALDK